MWQTEGDRLKTATWLCGLVSYGSGPMVMLPLQVEVHGERAGSNVQVLTLRLPKEGTVDDVLQKLQEQVGAEYAGKNLRFMEILYNKVYKVS